ncbi:MAG TPA: efflux RND transporter periplasmic adaptor subunit, partial [Verrucomicrobiae bacterium]|nr:efflux RND transporter periplasmic adaptor subunit [Verrucomicrobiae bacterium]
MRIRRAAAVLAAAVVAACSRGEKVEKQVAKPPVAVETAAAAASPLVEGILVTGSLEPKFSVDVRTQIPGLVREVYVTEWVPVRKGTPLARIDTAEVEAAVRRAEAAVQGAKGGLAQAQVAAARAERELARTLKLKEAGLATQQGVDEARSEQAASEARIETAKAQIRVAEEELRQARARLAKGLVVSPLDGVVANRGVNPGDLAGDAAGGKPVFRIVDNRVLNLTVAVPSVDSGKVRVGQPLEFAVDALPGRTFRGKVMFINPEIDPADRSLRVVAEVANAGGELKGGLFARGRIITGERKDVLQVPRQALSAVDSAAGTAEMFVTEKDTARLRKVKTGIAGGDLVEIISGLAPGERYVVKM